VIAPPGCNLPSPPTTAVHLQKSPDPVSRVVDNDSGRQGYRGQGGQGAGGDRLNLRDMKGGVNMNG